MELEDLDAIKEVMEESEAQKNWSEVMDGILEPSEDDGWMDEVYRMR